MPWIRLRQCYIQGACTCSELTSEHFSYQRVPGREPPIHGRDPNPGATGYRAHRGFQPAIGEYMPGCSQNPISVSLGVRAKREHRPRRVLRLGLTHCSHFIRKWKPVSVYGVAENMTPTGIQQSPHSTPAMRAALFDRYGPPEVLYEGTVPVPTIGPAEVLIRVSAATVNGGELILRSGRLPSWFMRGPFPRQTGLDFVGQIAQVGTSVTEYSVGQNVWGLLDEKPDDRAQALRSLAEFVAVRPDQISVAPRTLSPIDASTLPVGGLTALVALRRHARLRQGERVLVRGAAGGVGSATVQLAKVLGAGEITGLASAGSVAFVKGLGADEVHDYRTTRPTDLGEFDVVIDTVGTTMGDFRRLLTPRGRMVAVRFDTDHIVRGLACIAASAVHGSRRIRFFRGQPEHAVLAELAQLVDDGRLRPTVDQIFDLSDIAAAHKRLEAGGVQGKIVVAVN